MPQLRNAISTLKEAAWLWYEEDADFWAATVAYYVLFAIAPLLLLSVSLISVVYGRDLVASTFIEWGSVLGPNLTTLLTQAVQNLEGLSQDFFIPLLGALFFSGMTVVMFNTFTAGLHTVWDIPHEGIMGWLHKCRNSIVFIILFEGYLLLAVGVYLFVEYIEAATDWWPMYVVGALSSILLMAVLFSLMLRILSWRCPSFTARFMGALVASILFYIAQSLVALYVATTPVPGLYGAAGLLLILLIWIYVSVSILYYGAAVARVIEPIPER